MKNFEYMPGSIKLGIYARLVGKKPQLLQTIDLSLSPENCAALKNGDGVFFEANPKDLSYFSYISSRPNSKK
jgi:hypothetical protein